MIDLFVVPFNTRCTTRIFHDVAPEHSGWKRDLCRSLDSPNDRGSLSSWSCREDPSPLAPSLVPIRFSTSSRVCIRKTYVPGRERGALGGPGIKARIATRRQDGVCHEHSCCLPTNPCGAGHWLLSLLLRERTTTGSPVVGTGRVGTMGDARRMSDSE